MQATPTDPSQGAAPPVPGKLLFDISGIDQSGLAITKDEIEKFIPHRGHMSLLDGLIWHNPDFSLGIGFKNVRHDEFWVAGHFPGKPIFPGVLMIETAAQLACFMFVVQKGRPMLAVFLRIDNAVFRSQVVPGDKLLLLCTEVKRQKRRFISNVQGLVGTRIAFEAQLTGMSVDPE